MAQLGPSRPLMNCSRRNAGPRCFFLRLLRWFVGFRRWLILSLTLLSVRVVCPIEVLRWLFIKRGFVLMLRLQAIQHALIRGRGMR